ncbi:MAG: hypothetical protein A2921_01020 [Candidatus Magasanikbacteria bacterium RIFCSPLOWO2_01_FULL_43_20b]|uniref:Uncharacterized protein n=1 Tax=Candidatus Magasanikbacteria bacterium RIFCSPLOWO2_12_FULL_43_12 TaxID=1798692 RepID=A0A1F6MRH6_9BACT|nr:MAG: hypothetical protein A3C74_03765 [Candidatus Magasanikbacteria bacterium RIFCSPHIGHO2_02_FULL_44_13]OGH72158.1 MAG: hypothetical protein A3I93_00495 [Candidatus Magasanikbacteria bacterium RIFCSPLOWO2_02_FULL_43_22]OGH73465.1 MAG: hypothetical protein A2921_01020 [Candidatus Magasanikbacteria bacterium RIFCSPLOWO2_01_FULL_43_20b]OGH74264.1 MAG: hypothetical protein A3G00_00110 [Candidatus Magasanikbacteria bacterium RIFCSPLOWO2_12_FULL_43_12]
MKQLKVLILVAISVIVSMLVVVFAEIERRETGEWVAARNLCWKNIKVADCQEANLSDDGKCALKTLPNGTRCRGNAENFCVLSCICEDGKSQRLLRDCDDGNYCTYDICGWEASAFEEPKCLNFAVPDGFHCGPFGGYSNCELGVCVMPDGVTNTESWPAE